MKNKEKLGKKINIRQHSKHIKKTEWHVSAHFFNRRRAWVIFVFPGCNLLRLRSRSHAMRSADYWASADLRGDVVKLRAKITHVCIISSLCFFSGPLGFRHSSFGFSQFVFICLWLIFVSLGFHVHFPLILFWLWSFVCCLSVFSKTLLTSLNSFTMLSVGSPCFMCFHYCPLVDLGSLWFPLVFSRFSLLCLCCPFPVPQVAFRWSRTYLATLSSNLPWTKTLSLTQFGISTVHHGGKLF